MTALEACARCGSPVVGNEAFCSNCGERIGHSPPRPAAGASPPVATGPARGSRAIFWILGVVAVLGIGLAVGAYVVVRRVSDAVHARLGPEGSAALGRVAQSLKTAEREGHRDKSFGCSLLSESDASAIAGTRVTRTESSRDGCTYFGIPDPALNPEAEAMKELPGGNLDPKTARMIDQMAGAMRSQVEQTDPGARAGPGGERPLFTLQVNAALSATMELAKKGGNAKAAGEAVPGLGDDAFFITMHRMFFVRKGTSYMLIQPQFVQDRRGVAIAAAQKIMESPHFGQ